MKTESDWHSLRLRLEALQHAVADEIRGYPVPIPACDAQFNHLLELRRLLPGELARLDLTADDESATPDDFIRSSPCAAALSGSAGKS